MSMFHMWLQDALKCETLHGFIQNDTQYGICSKRNYKLQDTCGLLRLCLICEIWPATVVGVPLLLPVSNFVLFFVGVFVSLPMFWFVRLTGGRFPSWARRAMSCVVIPSILSSGWSFKRKHSSVLRTIFYSTHFTADKVRNVCTL